MKTKIILFILFFAGYATAQDYKYFNDVSISKGRLSYFAPKEMSIRKERKDVPPGPSVSEVKYTKEFFNTIDPFIKEFFSSYTGDVNILKRVFCQFEYDENFKIYYYNFSYPTSHIGELSQWEEKLYHFLESCKGLDLTPFVYIWDKEKFIGASFTLNIFYMYRYYKDPSKVVFDQIDR